MNPIPGTEPWMVAAAAEIHGLELGDVWRSCYAQARANGAGPSAGKIADQGVRNLLVEIMARHARGQVPDIPGVRVLDLLDAGGCSGRTIAIDPGERP